MAETGGEVRGVHRPLRESIVQLAEEFQSWSVRNTGLSREPGCPRPDLYIGSAKAWEEASEHLRAALRTGT